MRAQQYRKMIGLGAVGVEYSDLGDAEARQRKRNGLADAARPDDGDDVLPGTCDQISRRTRETCRVGIVTDQPAITDHDGIDRPHGGRTRRQFVEQIDHRFLVWKGNVDAREAKPSHLVEQRAQLLAAGARNFDKLIVAPHTQGAGSLLVHRR